jgi:hypothetical protein
VFRWSDTNHGSLLQNTTYTGPPRLRSRVQVVRHKPRQLIVEYYLYTGPPHLRSRVQVVQTQTTYTDPKCCRKQKTNRHEIDYACMHDTNWNIICLLFVILKHLYTHDDLTLNFNKKHSFITNATYIKRPNDLHK